MRRFNFQPLFCAAAALTLTASGWALQQTQPTQTPEEIAARRRAYEQRQASERRENATDHKGQIDAETRAVYDQELAHRKRLGRIERLKTLFRERGDTEKLGRLEEVARKENRRYDAYLQKQREQLGPQRFERTQAALERGRQRGANPRAARGT